MTTRNEHHAVLKIVKEDASFDDWQEENGVGHVTNVDGRRGDGRTVTFHHVHNTTFEIGDDQIRTNADRRNIQKRCEREQTSRLGGQGEMRVG